MFISVAVFTFGSDFKNQVNLNELARYTNGEIFLYESTNKNRNTQFYYDLYSILVKKITWESVFRVRVGAGFKVR